MDILNIQLHLQHHPNRLDHLHQSQLDGNSSADTVIPAALATTGETNVYGRNPVIKIKQPLGTKRVDLLRIVDQQPDGGGRII